MKKLMIIFLGLLLITACNRSKNAISLDQAQTSAVSFVNERVRFTTSSESSDQIVVNRASNHIVNSTLKNGDWYIDIYVTSIIENESRDAFFTVVVDGKSGEALDLIQH